jgi:hypothetical protein
MMTTLDENLASFLLKLVGDRAVRLESIKWGRNGYFA